MGIGTTKGLNTLFGLFIAFMIMSVIGCSNAENPTGERVIYYTEINDTMTYAENSEYPGFFSRTFYGNFDFTKSDSIKIEYTYLTNRTWFGFELVQPTIGDTFYYYNIFEEPETPCISDSAYHTFSKCFKSGKQKSNSLSFGFSLMVTENYWNDTLRYIILKDIKITEK